MTQFSLHIHEHSKGAVVAACDTDLLGETFTDGTVTLDITEAFYGGDDADAADIDEIVTATNTAMTANFVGETLIAALIEQDVITEDEVQHVDGVPHVQLFFI